ncbi:MAG: hypothetical protein MR413_09270, partial [Clostridia bacterium]|nr:hypothetical protein [Clostridia bacterium]
RQYCSVIGIAVQGIKCLVAVKVSLMKMLFGNLVLLKVLLVLTVAPLIGIGDTIQIYRSNMVIEDIERVS